MKTQKHPLRFVHWQPIWTLGVSIAEINLGIEISCWRRGVIGIMEFRASVFPNGVTEIPKLAKG
jgi:hypothetical protein